MEIPPTCKNLDSLGQLRIFSDVVYLTRSDNEKLKEPLYLDLMRIFELEIWRPLEVWKIGQIFDFSLNGPIPI